MTTGLALLLAGWWAIPLSLLGTLFEHTGLAELSGLVETTMQTTIERGSDVFPSVLNAIAQTPGGTQLYDLLETLTNLFDSGYIFVIESLQKLT